VQRRTAPGPGDLRAHAPDGPDQAIHNLDYHASVLPWAIRNRAEPERRTNPRFQRLSSKRVRATSSNHCPGHGMVLSVIPFLGDPLDVEKFPGATESGALPLNSCRKFTCAVMMRPP